MKESYAWHIYFNIETDMIVLVSAHVGQRPKRNHSCGLVIYFVILSPNSNSSTHVHPDRKARELLQIRRKAFNTCFNTPQGYGLREHCAMVSACFFLKRNANESFGRGVSCQSLLAIPEFLSTFKVLTVRFMARRC